MSPRAAPDALVPALSSKPFSKPKATITLLPEVLI